MKINENLFNLFFTMLLFHTFSKKYKPDPLSVTHRWKGLSTEMVLKQCSDFWGHSLEGSKGGYSRAL